MSAWGTNRRPVPKRAPIHRSDMCCEHPELETFDLPIAEEERAGRTSVRCRRCGWQLGQPKRAGGLWP